MWFDGSSIHLNRKLLDKDRTERVYPVRGIFNSGAHCCVATDWPAMSDDPNPWFGIQTLITRANPSIAGYGALGPGQVLPLYTRAPAQAMGWGDLTGTPTVGKSAGVHPQSVPSVGTNVGTQCL